MEGLLLPVADRLYHRAVAGTGQFAAAGEGKRTALALFGSLKNSAHRLLESVRQRQWPEASYDATRAAALPIRLEDTS